MRWIYISRDEFKKKFPNLAREFEEGEYYVLRIERSRDPWRGYEPNVVDFIRRADSVEEAIEIIDYLLKKGELGDEEAEKLKKQLKDKGLRSFGPKKGPDYYLKSYLEEELDL